MRTRIRRFSAWTSKQPSTHHARKTRSVRLCYGVLFFHHAHKRGHTSAGATPTIAACGNTSLTSTRQHLHAWTPDNSARRAQSGKQALQRGMRTSSGQLGDAPIWEYTQR